MRRIFAGAMSGTSADGVDVAFIRAEPSFSLFFSYGEAYDASLRSTILAARKDGAALTLKQFSQLAEDISAAYVNALRNGAEKAGIDFGDVEAIGVHGQTLFHAPPQTLQLINAPLIAAALNCPVVCDFRRADCAFGGQGAPLVPFADVALFQHSEKNRVLLNLGGIANISVLPAAAAATSGAGADTDTSRVRAFDTGPANCISDALCSRFAEKYRDEMGRADGVSVTFDESGQLALKGEVASAVLAILLSDPYFAAANAKSTDTPQMIRAFGQAVSSLAKEVFVPEDPLASTLSAGSPFTSLADALATACAFTAETVARGVVSGIGAIMAIATASTPAGKERGGDWELIVSGGGAFNARILQELKSRLLAPASASDTQPFSITSVSPSSSALGMPEAAKEAVAFALLARATVTGTPNNVPSCTGASKPVVGGCVAPAPLPHLRRRLTLESTASATAGSIARGSLLDIASASASDPAASSSVAVLPREVFETLAEGTGSAKKTRVERIVSFGNAASPEGFWYDQDENEWVGVVEGEAELSVALADGSQARVTLKEGEWIDLKAHQKHRVEATRGRSEGRPCIWLAVFY